MKKFHAIVGTIAIFFTATLFAIPAQAQTLVPKQVSYIALPHPDDEREAWSLVENSPLNYKIFITFTQGEETIRCEVPLAGNFPAPSPSPGAKLTANCSKARLNSWISFLTKISKSDPSIPGDFGPPVVKGPFPTNGVALKNVRNGVTYNASTSPKVWVDRQGRGAAIAFDLGDGDLTEQEIAWAITTVQNNRSALGLNTTLPDYNILGPFRNAVKSETCHFYNHVDHAAVHRALWNNNFNVVYRAAPTCKNDPDAVLTKSVTAASTLAMDQVGSGAFIQSYGWLGPFPISPEQNSVFHTQQSWWKRY